MVQGVEDISGRTSGAKAVAAARDHLTTIPNLLRKLGVARVTNMDEFRNLPIGTKAILPSGRMLWRTENQRGVE